MPTAKTTAALATAYCRKSLPADGLPGGAPCSALGLALLHLLATRNRCDACQWASTSTMI